MQTLQALGSTVEAGQPGVGYSWHCSCTWPAPWSDMEGVGGSSFPAPALEACQATWYSPHV